MHYTSKHLASAVEQRVDAKGRQSEKRKLRDKKAKETDVDSSRVSFRLFSDSQHYQQTSTALSSSANCTFREGIRSQPRTAHIAHDHIWRALQMAITAASLASLIEIFSSEHSNQLLLIYF